MMSRLNAWVKARLQERCAGREQAFYCEEARTKNLTVPEETELIGAMKKRFDSRGFSPKAKKKGALNIFFNFS